MTGRTKKPKLPRVVSRKDREDFQRILEDLDHLNGELASLSNSLVGPHIVDATRMRATLDEFLGTLVKAIEFANTHRNKR